MKLKTGAVDTEITAYVDANGYVVMTENVTGSDDYAVVVATTYGSWEGAGKDYQAKLLMPDGNVETVTVKNDAEGLLNHVVTYTKNSKDVYTLTDKHTGGTDEVDGATAAKLEIDNGKAAMYVDNDSTTVVANSKTVFFFYDSDAKEYSAYTGIKNVPSVKVTFRATHSLAMLRTML